ncbi:MAG: hypothetical protein PVF93_05545 [Chromatiaceae bacterium]|jgi:hypothetical protein
MEKNRGGHGTAPAKTADSEVGRKCPTRTLVIESFWSQRHLHCSSVQTPWALQTFDVLHGALSRVFPAIATPNSSTQITVSGQFSDQTEALDHARGIKV